MEFSVKNSVKLQYFFSCCLQVCDHWGFFSKTCFFALYFPKMANTKNWPNLMHSAYPVSIHNRVVCLNVAHPAQTSSFTAIDCRFWNNFKSDSPFTIVAKQFFFHLQKCKFCKWRNWGRVSEVRTHYPTCTSMTYVLL